MANTREQVTPLAAALNFTLQELRANRGGEFTASQRRRLRLRLLASTLEAIVLMFAPVLLAWGLVIGSTSQSLATTITDQRTLIGYLFGAVLMVVYIAANFRVFLLAADLWVGEIVIIEAPAQLWGRYLILDSYRFVLEEATLALVKPDVSYRACILPRSHTLLSIEFAE